MKKELIVLSIAILVVGGLVFYIIFILLAFIVALADIASF
jgi:hypothetical protein